MHQAVWALDLVVRPPPQGGPPWLPCPEQPPWSLSSMSHAVHFLHFCHHLTCLFPIGSPHETWAHNPETLSVLFITCLGPRSVPDTDWVVKHSLLLSNELPGRYKSTFPSTEEDMRLREGNWLAQGDTARKWQSWDSNLVLLNPELVPS